MIDYLMTFGRNLDNNRYIKPVLILLVLYFAYRLGGRASSQYIFYLVLMIGGITIFLILHRHPEWGIIALILIAFCFPWELSTGTKVTINLAFITSMLLVGVWILKMIVIDRQIRLKSSRLNLPACLFIVATAISLLAGNLSWIPFAQEQANLPAQIGAWLLYALPVILLIMVSNQIKTVRLLKILTTVFLVIGTIVLIGRWTPAPIPTIVNNLIVPASQGSVFWIFLVSLAAGQALVNRDLKMKWRICLSFVVILAFSVGLLQNREWLSGWLPPLIALFVIIYLINWRAGIILSILGIVFYLAFNSEIISLVMTSSQQYSQFSRAEAWKIMQQIIQFSPVICLGPANYYFYTPLYPILGFAVSFNSHNNYIDLIAQYGVIGAITFFWLIGELFLLGVGLLRRIPGGFEKGYLIGTLGGLVGMLASGMMGDWFMPFVYNIGIPGFRAALFGWIFLGGMVALSHIENNKVKVTAAQ